MCVNPRKLNVSGLPFPDGTVFGSEAAELHQTGFLRVNRESELPQSALHGYTEAPGIVSFVEPDDDVIGVSDHYHIACGIATSPLMRPQIEDEWRYMFASSGEITAPCGVPSSDARHSPSSGGPGCEPLSYEPDYSGRRFCVLEPD
jgi:hypothetical protein